LAQGKTVKEIVRPLEISEQTYYRWRKEYGGLDTTQARKMKEMEKENAPLKRLVADLSLDNAILKEKLSKKANPERRREAVEQAQSVFPVSERRICWG